MQRRSDNIQCQIQPSILIILCEADTAMASINNKQNWEVSEIEEGKDMYIYGIPVNVSPTKESWSSKGVFYLEAKLSDGKHPSRVVSLDTFHLDSMKNAKVEQSVVALNNSTVKKSSFTSENKRDKQSISSVTFIDKATIGFQMTTSCSHPVKVKGIMTVVKTLQTAF